MREIVLDTETTGLDPFKGHRIIEIGCVEIINRLKTGRTFHQYINPNRDVPEEAFNIHGISTEFLRDKPNFANIHEEFLEFLGDSPLVIHNAPFDMKFINHELKLLDKKLLSFTRVVDTLVIARKKFPGSPASLDALCKRFGVNLESRTKHGALLDSELLYEVYFELCGGSQSELKLKYKKKIIKDHTENFKRPILAARKHTLTEEEKKCHQELMAKIKNPMWLID